MTIQEAIESLENIIEYWTCRPTEVEAAKLAIAALEASQSDAWIPVTSGKLPEENEVTEDIFDPVTFAVVDTKYRMVSDLVLVTVRDYEKDDVFVCDDITVDGKWCNFDDGNGVYEVIAWKPFPTPYKEDV